MPFSFSHRKATQSLNVFAQNAGGSVNKLKALKLVYFADRYHLRRYGRPVIGDEYLAMNYGPVPSGTKDIAEMSDFLGEEEKAYAAQFVKPISNLEFKSLQQPDLRVFSESDREALEWSWQQFGGKDGFALADMTHLYPEWKRHESMLTSKLASRVPMNYRDSLLDPPSDVEPCFALNDQEREAVAEGIEDLATFERLWR